MTTENSTINTGYDKDSEYIRMLGQCKHIKDLENARKIAPSKLDYQKLHSLLKDFNINISLKDIPDFDSIIQMELWKKNKIKEKFDSLNKPKEYKKPMFTLTKLEENNEPKKRKSKKHKPVDWSKINISF